MILLCTPKIFSLNGEKVLVLHQRICRFRSKENGLAMNSCSCVSYVPVLPNNIMSPKKYVLLPALDQFTCLSLRRLAELGNGGWKKSHVKGIDLQACFCL